MGPDKLILGADYKDRKISAGGWLENSDKDLISFLSDYKIKGCEIYNLH